MYNLSNQVLPDWITSAVLAYHLCRVFGYRFLRTGLNLQMTSKVFGQQKEGTIGANSLLNPAQYPGFSYERDIDHVYKKRNERGFDDAYPSPDSGCVSPGCK